MMAHLSWATSHMNSAWRKLYTWLGDLPQTRSRRLGRHLLASLTCLALALGGMLGAISADAQSSEAPTLPNEGQALAAHLRSSPPPDNVEVVGMIRVRRDDGRRTSRPFNYRVLTGQNQWQQIFECPAHGTQPAQVLVIQHHADAPPVYQLGRSLDESDAVIFAGEEAMVPLVGSDFWLADLGLEFLHWPEQRIDHNTRLTMRKGRSCRVLESVNPRPGAEGYTRVRSWVDIKTGGIIIAEAYGNDHRIAKEFEIGGFTKIDGQWALKNMEMRNLRLDTRTILEFNYEGSE